LSKKKYFEIYLFLTHVSHAVKLIFEMIEGTIEI